MRLGVFGGRFDPIHLGHLILAQDVLEALSLDRILFLVSHNPPHKRANAPFQDRLRMAELATEGCPKFQVSDIEKRLGLPKSYTVQVLEALSRELPARMFFILGTDEFAKLHTWHRPERLFELAELVVLLRPGAPLPVSPYTERVVFVSQRQLDLSSSEIRRRVATGLPIDFMVPGPVARYIAERGLYRWNGSRR